MAEPNQKVEGKASITVHRAQLLGREWGKRLKGDLGDSKRKMAITHGQHPLPCDTLTTQD